ncbi:unnamed protein product [Acanthoscelides obtectus]|uniref:Uncharacterized protein n=1 Tax=Acanthoscelides obtectus TaxID=200917 RepID=A0A9P0L8T9_ACAOB|nr:unnamed protein product [Acanthoscelides obtectus]CAK1635962.1 Zinc finger protein 420 [Acanthoscelides obtectus]
MEPWRSYSTICRLCLQKDGFMLGIFNHIQGKDKSIYKKIIDCTALQISHGDGLPNVICHRCLFKVEFCLEFRQLCFMSDATLRQINGVMGKENGSENIAVNGLPVYEQLGVGGNDDSDVVMVVDPMANDYESDYESDKDPGGTVGGGCASDQENMENLDGNDAEQEGRGVSMCKYCDHAFTDPQECLNHESSAHNSDTPYACSACFMSFADRVLYSAHLKSVHKNDKPYNCPQCNRTFARRSDLRKHTIVHTGVKPYTCTVCYKSFSRNTNLSKHMRIHSGTKPFVCPKCPKTFTSKGDLTRHAVIHSGQRPFACNFCHLSFGRRDKLQRHEKRHFPVRDQDGTHDRSKELQMMRDAVYATPPGDRAECGEGKEGSENMIINLDPFNHNNFGTSATPQRGGDNSENEPHNDHDSNINNHIKLEDLKEDPDLANQLPTRAPEENYGRQKRADNLKRYKCSHCPKKFSKIDNLHVHQQIHSGSRPFSCHICSKNFIKKRELDRHIATHSGAKPFKCPRCNKSFGRKDKMLRHARIHDVNKSFNCKECGSTFYRRDSLHQHMKTHAALKSEYSEQHTANSEETAAEVI